MLADDRYVGNPALYFDVVSGGVSSTMLRERLLSLQLTDNARGYDALSMAFDNVDGEMTRIENLALGLTMRVRIGYYGDTGGWQSFVLSRVKGGVGVYGKGERAVGEGNGEVTYTGRNRNAADTKGRTKSSSPRVSGTGRKTLRGHKGKSTRDITRLNDLHRDIWAGPTISDRVLGVRRVSDAAIELAIRMGYPTSKILVQQTDDEEDLVVVPEGITAEQFLTREAESLGWSYKAHARDGFFRFHSRQWKRDTTATKHVFVYGSADVLDLQLDFDFRLPVPRTVKMGYHNPRNLKGEFGEATVKKGNIVIESAPGIYSAMGISSALIKGNPERERNLQRDYVHPVAVGKGTRPYAGARSLAAFRSRHLRAASLTLKITGNPDVLSNQYVDVKGTGNELVDRSWHVTKVVHDFDGETYVTQLKLQQVSKSRAGGGGGFRIIKGQGQDSKAADRSGNASSGDVAFKIPNNAAGAKLLKEMGVSPGILNRGSSANKRK